MHQRDVERFAFLYLCGPKDKHILTGKTRITYIDFERLTYLTDFFGMTDYNLNIWNKFVEQFKNQLDVLIEMYDKIDLESEQELDLGEHEADCKLREIWVSEFCRNAPNKELQIWLEAQTAEIYKEKGLEPFWQADQ